MKRTKDSHAEARVISCNIGYIAGVLGMTNADLARVMGISEQTFYNRKSRPWEFRVGEIEKLSAFATQQGMAITSAQIFAPFSPGEISRYGEVSA